MRNMADRHSPEILDLCLRMRGRGYKLTQIERVTGVSKSAISYHCRKSRDSMSPLDAFKEVALEIADEKKSEYRVENPTDNDRIRVLLEKCFEAGKANYGHGFRVMDDTRQWGTEEDSWLEMGIEEILDAVLYLAAHLIRLGDKEKRLEGQTTLAEFDVDPEGSDGDE